MGSWPSFLFLIFFLALPSGAQAASSAAKLEVEGTLGPATADYFARSLEQAQERGASVVVVRIDTPGGLDASMRSMIQEVLASELPVVCYVAPSGARAASAGTFLLYACHVAAMAPGTTLGAATPVRLQGAPPLGGQGSAQEPSALERKVLEDAVAYIRALADLRGRNAEWAERAVREGASLSAREARARDVIDLVARDEAALWEALDGRRVPLGDGAVVLETTGIEVVPILPDWRTRLLAVVTNPNVALLLLIVGFYGLVFELASPGFILPGVLGAVCLAFGLYGLQVLPLNYAGLGLLLLGVALMVAEVFVSSFGVLGVGGAIAFLVGALLLVDTDVPAFQVSRPLVVLLGATSAAFFLVVVRMAVKARRRAAVSGREGLVGSRGRALEDWAGAKGSVRVQGERWRAISDAALAPGDEVIIVDVEDLTLTVRPTEARKEPP